MGPDLQMQNYRISSSGICRREITCMNPQEDEISVEKPRDEVARRVKERKPPAKGGFTPSKRSPGTAPA